MIKRIKQVDIDATHRLTKVVIAGSPNRSNYRIVAI